MEKENEVRTCENCVHNEDGFCDRLGCIVEDDDQRCNGKYWDGGKIGWKLLF